MRKTEKLQKWIEALESGKWVVPSTPDEPGVWAISVLLHEMWTKENESTQNTPPPVE